MLQGWFMNWATVQEPQTSKGPKEELRSNTQTDLRKLVYYLLYIWFKFSSVHWVINSQKTSGTVILFISRRTVRLQSAIIFIMPLISFNNQLIVVKNVHRDCL